MKLNLLTLNKAAPSLQALANYTLPIKASYDLKKRLKAINPELEIMANVIKEKCSEKLAPVQECVGTEIEKEKLRKELSEEFEKEITEFLKSQEIELDIQPMKLDDLGDIQIQPIHLLNLDFLIQE